MVNLKIDGKDVSVKKGTTILEAAKKINIKIPTLCKWKGLNEIGACRVCVIEIKGMGLLPASCVTIAEEGMEIYTNSPRVYDARRTNLKLILSEHKYECATCTRNGNCELQTLVDEMNIIDQPFKKNLTSMPWPSDFPLIRDNDKCIKCMRCIQVCEKIADTGIWDLHLSGGRTTVWTKNGKSIKDMNCTLCGQCITHCPVGALSSRDDTGTLYGVNGELDKKDKVKVVSIAPAVRTSWGEELGLGKNVSVKKLVGVLKALGFDYVFDVNFGADLTIMEEGTELLSRLKHKNNYKWPMFTSCCPAWVRWVKTQHSELVPNLSTSKSPNQMQGAIIKSYFANIIGKKPEDIFNVSIMPCVAKKAESNIQNINSNEGIKDVDLVLTIRELVDIVKERGIDVSHIEEQDFDSPLGESTGAGVIFGATGGVMEASLRTAYFLLTGDAPKKDAFKVIRSLKDRREATFTINNTTLKIAIVSGLKNASKLLDDINKGKVSYDFVEVMACPGGCINGGGQPIHKESDSKVKTRAKDIYIRDENTQLKNSYENPAINKLYKEFLGKPNGELAHHLLHTDHNGWTV